MFFKFILAALTVQLVCCALKDSNKMKRSMMADCNSVQCTVMDGMQHEIENIRRNKFIILLF